jgi:AcrR family transcriptional regulator
MKVKDKWLDEGLAVLIEDGAPGIRIDRIAARLGLSKGSFHHHFAGAAGYRTALLQRYESDALAALGGLAPTWDEPAERTLAGLRTRARELFDPRLEVAVRAWAFQDPEVRATQERVDSARLAALESLWLAIVDDPRRARTAALLPHLLSIGASVALPPIDPTELDDVFGMLVELIRPITGADR